MHEDNWNYFTACQQRGAFQLSLDRFYALLRELDVRVRAQLLYPYE